MQRYLLECNANHEGAFRTSQESDAVLHEARAAMADLLNAASPDEIVFGNNMTTITFNMARALASTAGAGRRDRGHAAGSRCQHLTVAADRRGPRLQESPGWTSMWKTGTLKLDEFARAMERKPKIVAFGYASNALGTINPVRKLTQMAQRGRCPGLRRCRAVCATRPDRRAGAGAAISWSAPPTSSSDRMPRHLYGRHDLLE